LNLSFIIKAFGSVFKYLKLAKLINNNIYRYINIIKVEKNIINMLTIDLFIYRDTLILLLVWLLLVTNGYTVLLSYSVMLKSPVRNLRGQKSNHVKGWCGSGRVRSLGDFDGLDAPESRFLKPQINRVDNRSRTN
jgi:hypothetical protein